MGVATDGQTYTYTKTCPDCGVVLGDNDHGQLKEKMRHHMTQCSGVKSVAVDTMKDAPIGKPVAVDTIRMETPTSDTIMKPVAGDTIHMETHTSDTIQKTPSADTSVVVGGFMSPAASIDEAVNAFCMFDEAKKKLLRNEDVLWFGTGGKPVPANTQGAKPYLLKSAWRRMARFFGLSIEIMGRERLETGSGGYLWVYKYRISHPCGAFVESEGVCTSKDSFFTKGGKRAADEADVMLKAQSVAINRGVSDLLGSGEVSADELLRE